MKTADVRSVLVIGVDVGGLAVSAKRAGYDVFASDYFGDLDLKKACKKSLSSVSQQTGKSCGRLGASFSPHALLDFAKKLAASESIDGVLLASGLEDSKHVLTELNHFVPIIGNNPSTIEKVREKTTFFHELKRLNIHHPKTTSATNLEEAKYAAKDIGYPVVVKPTTSLGGAGVRKVKDRSELERVFLRIVSWSPEVLVQEFVSGRTASASFLSSNSEAAVLTFNEQLLGIREVGQKEPFGYCGNVVPAFTDNTPIEACNDVVKKIAAHFSLVGSNGVDLVFSKDGLPCVVEINPRFQGTLECVERVLGINLVYAHLKACIEGVLPTIIKRKPATSCVRLVLFARHRSTVSRLSDLDEVRDIPFPGVIVEEGEPICSVVVEDETRSSALEKAEKLARLVYGRVNRKVNG